MHRRSGFLAFAFCIIFFVTTGYGSPVTEEDEINQEVAMFMVIAMGHACDCVDDGRKALEAFIHGTYSIMILMDCQMPNMDGYEATSAIRDYEARTEGTAEIPGEYQLSPLLRTR